MTIVGKCTVIIHKPNGTQTSAVFQVTYLNGHAIIGRSTSRDIGYVHFPAIDCPPLSMTCKKARCINTAATCREADSDAQDTIFYHDWQQHTQRN